MPFQAFILFSTFFWVANVIGQTRTLIGKVVDQELRPFHGAKVFNADTSLLTTCDVNGNFSLTISYNTKSLLIASIGMEWKSLDLSDSCSNLEVILLPSGTFDFMTTGKVDRLRKKEFDKLPSLHTSAFKKGVFKNDKPCYVDKFIPIKKRLKEIHKSRSQKPST